MDLIAAHGNAVELLFIYIREAHPTDGWYMGTHRIRDPLSLEERRSVARKFEESLRGRAGVYVDGMDDAAMKAYAAWPDRLYLVGTDGRIRYAGKRGPSGFKPDELREAIKKETIARETVGRETIERLDVPRATRASPPPGRVTRRQGKARGETRGGRSGRAL